MDTINTATNTKRASYLLRRVAMYMFDNSDALVGDLDSVYVCEGGLRFSFELTDDASIPTITVTRECIVTDKLDHG